MLILGLDAASPSVVAGIVETGPEASYAATVRATRTMDSDRRHAEVLGPLIREVLTESGLGLESLDAIVVGLGPGPFTGLRIGVMTAAALGDALARPVHGVCTLDAIAASYCARSSPDGSFVVVADARRRECYWARYDAVASRISGPHVQRPGDLIGGPDWDSDELVIGDSHFSASLRTEVQPAQPDAMGLVSAAGELRGRGQPGPLEPFYLRRPDASPPAAPKRVTPK